MEKILAVITLTYRETVRKRIFLVVALFALVLVLSSALFPAVNPENRVKLVEIWLVRGISFFGMIMAIFLVSTSIPSDIEDRRMYLLLSKPISKETFLAGKFLGFCFVIALFMAVIGIIGIIYLHLIDFISSDKSSNISHPIAPIKASQFSFIQPAKQPNALMEGTYMEQHENNNTWKRLDVPWNGLSLNLKGEDKNYAAWYFENLEKEELSNPVRVKINALATEGKYKLSSEVALFISNPSARTNRSDGLLKKETVQRAILSYGKPVIVEFNPDYIDDLGRVQITIQRTNPYSELVITPESLVILSTPRSFEWNFLKCIIVIFLQIVLILALVMACSTILSGGVNILIGIFLYFTGSTMGFFRESVFAMERAMKIMEQSIITGKALPPDADVMPLWLMKTSKAVSDIVFSIVPDLGKYDATEYLLNMRVLPVDVISGALYYLGLYLLIAFIIGWIGFRSRDFK